MMKQMLSNSYLFGTNTPYIEALYDAYLANPASVEPVLARLFRQAGHAAGRRQLHRADVAHYPVITSFAQRAKEGTLQAGRATASPTASRSRCCN
jgi:2-oxoglutarate dehydrogenase E1 component